VKVMGWSALTKSRMVRLRTCTRPNASLCEWIGNATLEVPLGVVPPPCVEAWHDNESLGDCRAVGWTGSDIGIIVGVACGAVAVVVIVVVVVVVVLRRRGGRERPYESLGTVGH
jgi:hypothetical protein